MPPPRSPARPGVEPLESRIAMASVPAAIPTPPATLHPVPGSRPRADDRRAFAPADLAAYAAAYETTVGTAGYAPQYDFNGSGFIGQDDATPILRGLAPITPKGPLRLALSLAPGQQVKGHHPADSGGVTRLAAVTIVGRTTPNSIVFTDVPSSEGGAGDTANYKFEGSAIATDGRGDFTYTIPLNAPSHGGSLTNTEFLVRTPFNRQLIRAFPILRIR